jgi:hypothetical protein
MPNWRDGFEGEYPVPKPDDDDSIRSDEAFEKALLAQVGKTPAASGERVGAVADVVEQRRAMQAKAREAADRFAMATDEEIRQGVLDAPDSDRDVRKGLKIEGGEVPEEKLTSEEFTVEDNGKMRPLSDVLAEADRAREALKEVPEAEVTLLEERLTNALNPYAESDDDFPGILEIHEEQEGQVREALIDYARAGDVQGAAEMAHQLYEEDLVALERELAQQGFDPEGPEWEEQIAELTAAHQERWQEIERPLLIEQYVAMSEQEQKDVAKYEKMAADKIQADLSREMKRRNITDPAEAEKHLTRLAATSEVLGDAQKAAEAIPGFDPANESHLALSNFLGQFARDPSAFDPAGPGLSFALQLLGKINDAAVTQDRTERLHDQLLNAPSTDVKSGIEWQEDRTAKAVEKMTQALNKNDPPAKRLTSLSVNELLRAKPLGDATTVGDLRAAVLEPETTDWRAHLTDGSGKPTSTGDLKAQAEGYLSYEDKRRTEEARKRAALSSGWPSANR